MFTNYICKVLVLSLTIGMFAVSPAHASLFGLMHYVSKVASYENHSNYSRKTYDKPDEDRQNFYSEDQKRNSFNGCLDLFPNQKPFNDRLIPSSFKTMDLCSDQFAVLYSQTTKTPLIVVEKINSKMLRKAHKQKRTNDFYPDPRIPESGRAELADYQAESRIYDRGHQAPAGDQVTLHAMHQSFALSNMIPQVSESNRGAWSDIEQAVRKFVSRTRGNVYIYTGPIFSVDADTIGPNHVWVPSGIFKLVYDQSSHRSWAYLQPNDAGPVNPPVSYDDFVSKTGYDLLKQQQVK